MQTYLLERTKIIGNGHSRSHILAHKILESDCRIIAVDFGGYAEFATFELLNQLVKQKANILKARPVLVVFKNERQRSTCARYLQRFIPAEFHSDDYMLTENSRYAINLRLEEDIDSLNPHVLFDYVIICGGADISADRLYKVIRLYGEHSNLIVFGHEKPETKHTTDKSVWVWLLNHPEVQVFDSPATPADHLVTEKGELCEGYKSKFKEPELPNITITPESEPKRRHFKEYAGRNGDMHRDYTELIDNGLYDTLRHLAAIGKL